MAKKYFLANSFSLQMLDVELDHIVKIEPAAIEEVAEADFISAVGHADTATVLSGLLNKEVPCQRISIHLEPGDTLYVAQVIGGRLPEGCTTLPEGIDMKFLKVKVPHRDPDCSGCPHEVGRCLANCGGIY